VSLQHPDTELEVVSWLVKQQFVIKSLTKQRVFSLSCSHETDLIFEYIIMNKDCSVLFTEAFSAAAGSNG
jgi:hypothetical protein